jgi:hypothetical protein
MDAVTINDQDDGFLPVKLSAPDGSPIGPTEFTFLPSASRTTTQTQADQVNAFARGILIFINMSVVGTGSITVEVDGKDPVSGQYYTILASAAIAANGFTVLRVYPGLTAAANAVASDLLPRTFRLKVTANNANPATYSVGYELLP